jgi:hypothetical protein
MIYMRVIHLSMATQDNGLNLTGYLIEICFTIIVIFLLTREDRGHHCMVPMQSVHYVIKSVVFPVFEILTKVKEEH